MSLLIMQSHLSFRPYRSELIPHQKRYSQNVQYRAISDPEDYLIGQNLISSQRDERR